MFPSEVFGDVLKKLRKAKGLSQEELSFKASLDRTYISMLERGHRQPSLNSFFGLSKALDIDPIELIQLVKARIEHPNAKK